MAAAAVELLRNPDQLDTMATAARQTAQQRFCSTKIIPKYEQYYERVLERAGNGAKTGAAAEPVSPSS
jgi:hypothetical protein